MQHTTALSDPRALAESALAGFIPITLEEMEAVRLMNRVDRKFVFHISQLGTILTAMNGPYRSLEVEGTRVSPYRTMYFDTEGLNMYRDHHNGKPNRTKVRYRHYLQSGAMFFEVKRKVRGLRTDKVRIPITAIPDKVNGAETELLNTFSIEGHTLQPTMDVLYGRATLVRTDGCERVTIDVGLTFAQGEKVLGLPNIVIAEVKTDNHKGGSPVISLMKNMGIRPMGMSKYSVAVAMLHDGAKTNAFKAKMRRIFTLNDSETLIHA